MYFEIWIAINGVMPWFKAINRKDADKRKNARSQNPHNA